MHKKHESFTYQIKKIGREETPVIVVDNLITAIEDIRADAIKQSYCPPEIEFSYPGIRANIAVNSYIEVVKNTVSSIFEKHFTTGQNLSFNIDEATYSLLTSKEEELAPNQCIPHFDGPWGDKLAVLHYINEGDFGGTAFYRHIPTKFEKITTHRVTKYRDKATLHTEKHGFPQHKYFTTTSEHFELLDVVDYVPNRLVIYPTALLHSGYIEFPEKNISDDPKTGRLTGNFFMTATI